MNTGNNTGKNNMKPACETTSRWLFDYACHTGELDQTRTELVRLHLASCPDCRNAAKDITAVVDILHTSSPAVRDTPAHLSEERRRRIMESLRETRD